MDRQYLYIAPFVPISKSVLNNFYNNFDTNMFLFNVYFFKIVLNALKKSMKYICRGL